MNKKTEYASTPLGIALLAFDERAYWEGRRLHPEGQCDFDKGFIAGHVRAYDTILKLITGTYDSAGQVHMLRAMAPAGTVGLPKLAEERES